MEDNCSNCQSSKVRRATPYCTNKKSFHYQTLTYLHLVCDCHKRGSQVELLHENGEVFFPAPEKSSDVE